MYSGATFDAAGGQSYLRPHRSGRVCTNYSVPMAPPVAPPSAFPVGACLHGKDGKLYQINTTSRSVRRWLPCGSSQEHIDNLLVPVRLWFEPESSCESSLLLSPQTLQFLRSVIKTATSGLYDYHVAYDLSEKQYVVSGYIINKDTGFAERTMSDVGRFPMTWRGIQLSLTSVT